MTQKVSQQERHQMRQDEIIVAARRCFRASGFHAASMSQIALEAQLSVGQIYRYFASKDAIIEEMIRRIIDYRIAEMESNAQTQHIPQVLAWRQTLSHDDDALMLEVAAEATRNPRVAAMMAQADALGIDRHRVVLMGHSAGAHLVALVGTDERYLRQAGLSFADVAGVLVECPGDGALPLPVAARQIEQ